MNERICNAQPVTGDTASALSTHAAPAWRKSSYSNHEGACVELAKIDQETILFRDSKEPDGPILSFTRTEVSNFLTAVKRGDLATD